MLENLTELLLPGLLLAAGAAGLRRKRDVYGDLLAGAQDGLRLLATLAPSLVLMLTAVTMLRESGFFDWLTPLAAPVFRVLGIPPGACAAGAHPPAQRQRGARRGDGADAALRRGFADRADSRGHARLVGDNVLYHQRLLWRRGRARDALRCPGGADRRSHGVLHGGIERTTVF